MQPQALVKYIWPTEESQIFQHHVITAENRYQELPWGYHSFRSIWKAASLPLSPRGRNIQLHTQTISDFPKTCKRAHTHKTESSTSKPARGKAKHLSGNTASRPKAPFLKNLSQKQNLKLFPIIPVQVQNCLVPTVIKVRSWPFACTGLCMKQIAILWFRA